MYNPFSDKFYYLLGQRRSNKLRRALANKGEVKKILSKNSAFYNIHKGKRCFIIGNGPSAGEIDFRKLADEYTFTVNQFSRFKNYKDLKTNYHVFSDERLFKLSENKKEDLDTLKHLSLLNSKDSNVQFFSKLNSKSFLGNSKFFTGARINYYFDGLIFHQGYELDADISKRIPWFPTCVDYCIFIAIYMGFEEIYLLGCECTGFMRVSMFDSKTNSNLSYGYGVSSDEEVRIKKQLVDYGIADELEIGAKLLRYYDYMAEFANKMGVKIVNCTDGGLLYSFERKTLDDVLRKDFSNEN